METWRFSTPDGQCAEGRPCNAAGLRVWLDAGYRFVARQCMWYTREPIADVIVQLSPELQA